MALSGAVLTEQPSQATTFPNEGQGSAQGLLSHGSLPLQGAGQLSPLRSRLGPSVAQEAQAALGGAVNQGPQGRAGCGSLEKA